MKEKEIKKYYKEKASNLSMTDSARLSSIRDQVLNGKDEASTKWFNPLTASGLTVAFSLLLAVPLLPFQKNNLNEYDQIMDLAFDIQETKEESIYDWTEDDYNNLLTMTDYESVSDIYY